MSNQIIGNTEYNSIKEKAYINGTQKNIMQLAAELDKAGINYSGRVSDYRSAITVEAADRARTLEILKTILNADKENIPVENSDKNIIGNAEYRYIPNKRYVRGEAEAMLRTADRLTAENISFSGRIKGDTVTLTVSGEETQELVKKYFAEEKNRIENIQSAYFLALSSDTFEDGYYFSEVNMSTGEEIAPYRGKFGDISMFLTVDEAEQYARVTGITLSNTDEQLNEWRSIEIETEKEKDRQLNLSRSREIIKRLPMTDSGYEEHFVLRDEAVDWIYFNPDGADGEGQFVQTTLYADDLIAAYNARSDTDDYRKFGQSAFIETIQNGIQTVINADTVDFEFLADTFIKSRGNENVIVSAPIVSGNGYDNNFERIIDLLENHFEDVRSYKENHITETSDKISVEGHIGTWYVIDSEEIEGRKLFLLEHELYGDEAANIIIDENKNLVMEGVYNGFDDYRDSLIYADDKQFISRDFAVELWENGFTVFMNDRNNALSYKSDDSSLFELFTEEKNNAFYAFNNDIVQQRFLDDTVTLLDGLNDASMREASHTENAIDTIDDYAKEMSEDGECAYKWSDGLTEWQNISASIRSGNSEYIYSWLRDLRSVLPSLEENQGVSVETALNYLDNYEKEYMGKLSIDELKKGTRLVYNNTNWEVTHVNNNVLALKNLDSDSQMSSTIIEHWQNVVTRSKVEFIAEKEKPPVGKYVPDENLPLSQQLYELAKRELADYENSLDTAEKAKAAAYELSVKRDILSYIEYDLSEDVTDSDVENACRRLISSGYPLDTFYRDWLKNEYDNRMEAIKMTAADTFRKENKIMSELKSEITTDVIEKTIHNKVFEQLLNSEKLKISAQNNPLDVFNLPYYDEVDNILVEMLNNGSHSQEEQKEIIRLINDTDYQEKTFGDYESVYNHHRSAAKNLEFTVVTFEDDSVYVLAGKIDDNNIVGTAAYEDMMKKNFDVDKMASLDENIKVNFAVYHTGDGEAVMPTDEELAEIRNNLDDFIGGKVPVSTENSYLYPWKNVDDILSDLEEFWTERHNNNPQILDDSGSFYSLLPDSLNPTAESGGVRYYDTYSSVKLIKLKGKDEWLDPVDAAVEMNRRGVDLNDIEMLDVNAIDEFNEFSRREITPEQFAVYELQIENDRESYSNKLEKYKTIVKAREAAHNAGLPFREAPADEESEEDFNPYAFDGTMSPEDYELMHKLMREDSFEIYQVKKGEEYHYKRFAALSELDGTPNIADYDLVFSGRLSEQDISAENKNEILEAVFDKFNNDRPEDFKGHSLSVSDIVVLHKDSEDTAHYVDTMGFSDVPEFLKEKTQEIFNEEIMETDISNDNKERRVHNAFQRLKDNHDFSPEVITLLDRVEKHIIRYDEENFSSKIFELPLFEQTYGRVSRVNEKLFGGELRPVIDEVNRYITPEQETNFTEKETSPVGTSETLKEGDIVTFADRPDVWRVKSITDLQIDFENTNAAASNKSFSHIDFGQHRENLRETLKYAFVSKDVSEQENNEALEKAKQLINDFCDREYGSTGDFSDLHNVSIAYTTLTDDELLHIQVTADLIDFKFTFELNGEKYNEEKYNSLEELIEYELSNLYFDELVYVPDRVLEKYISGSEPTDLMSEFSETIEENLKTVTNQYNSYLLVQDVVYSLRDLQDGYADNYDWKNYSEAFKKVLDSNIHTDVAIPLYKSEADKILSDAADGKVISADDIAKALLNLELVLQNSHLLKNPEEKVEQISFFDSTPSRTSSDEIGYSSALEVTQSEKENTAPIQMNSPVGNVSEQKHISAADIKIGDKFLFQGEEVTVSSLKGIYPDDISLSKIEFDKSSGNEREVIRNANKFSLASYGIYLGNSEMEKSESEKKLKSTNASDYTITDKNYGTEGGAKTRFANNVEAIKLLKAIESENRPAAPEEQEVLAKYVGWGGIPEAFDSSKENWKKEYTELKNLLTDEEYRAARVSTMNAHYTSPTVISAIYDGLHNLGFEGGKILEPAMGIGNFFGAMPESLHNNSELHGVELDSITGRIAKQLYPSADIQIKGYENTDFANGSFDVAVGNVPFGGYKVNDKDYNKQNLFIHDYFFAKTLDKVRAGGVVAFVTSKGTLDKENPEVRKYLAERADLLGAIRLPNNAFKANAGTEVTSDIIFLQKRENPISIDENPPEWVYKDMLPNGIAVNKYFADHPEMILGEIVEGNKLYGNQTDASMCVPIEGADLSEQLAEAVKNITGAYKAAEKGIADVSPLGNLGETPCPPNAPKFSYIVQDDILYYRKADITMEKVNAPENVVERIKAMVQLRDTVHSLLELQLDNTDGSLDTAISEAQTALNKQYDEFSEKYGLISSAENKSFFKNDNSYHLIKALEKLDKDGNFIGKADIFSKITVNPKTVVDHCDNAQDALILSLSEKMCVNLDYMSILTGKSEEELIDELGDKIFQNPQKHMRWESADEYLTGNIRQKLAAAEAEGLTRNAEALRAVMPERIEAADISVKLGSAWVDPDYIRQFIVETLKPDFITSKNIEVTYMPATDKWKVEGWRSAYENTLASETYGTQDIKAYEIIEATLNMQKVEIRQRVKDEYGNELRDSKGRYVYEVNQKKTMIAQAKQDELKRKFSDWIFSDPDRREKLVDVYNEKFNSVRLREYDGSHLNFVGMNSAITLKEHQKNAVARGLYSNGNTLLAHEVGAGKTYEMIAIAMEGKRLGLHNKSLITAPNGLTEQWGNAFRTLYPNANVLVATEKDFQKENRRDLFAKIATGDWDAVIIGHSQFDMIHLSRERELDGLYSEVAKLEAALDEMLDENGKKSFSVKQIEKSIKTYEDKIQKLLDKTPEDDMLCFEKLGVDKIFVDESQAYKNLDTPTKMRNVSGIGSGGSGRSMQLLMKCKYLDEITGGRGVTFASGTPISNSMSEMYTLMRYLQADKLAETGINSFDRWASVFGETITAMELSPEGNGKYQMKTRFAKFQNLPELMNIFKECADIKTAESLDLDRPDFEMHNVNVPATAMQATMIKVLGERAVDIRSGNVDPTEDNMCKLTVDGRKIGLDQRCMDPNLPDDPKSKVNVCINNVFDIWQRTASEKSTQLIFCDLATPQPPLNENMYTVYRKNPNGGYSGIYAAKLGEKDTAEKILKKLNGKKPPKNYKAGEIANSDIIMLKRVNYEEETAYNTAFEMKDGKLTEVSPETWEKLRHSPTEYFESERRFCVYDDIKQKLVAKGVPENEIAFIHDAEKAEDKQKLYDKMNKGEIRVLIGSTQKCGAGMNAQERMIALHDLDAPMRPSDMEQRHGRIIRQGNTNSKVDIYRYTTDKTFDAYLYQMLENKQRFISQIMTDKSPVRSCEDVDEVALDYAEVKALCAGNPLIREKIDLETEITKLNVLKSAFLSQKYSLQDKAYKSLPEHRKYTEHYVEKLKADIEAVKSVKPLTNEDGKNYYPVTVGGKEYHDKEKAGQAIREAIIKSVNFTEKGQCAIGSYRGFEMSAFMETSCGLTKIKIALKGVCDHSCEINMDKSVRASGNIVRLDNVINSIELELQKQEDHLQSLTADIKEAEIAAEAEFPQEKELIEKEKRLAEVNTLLTNSEVRLDNSMELYAALVEICPELESYDTLYCKYEKGEDSGIEPLIVEKNGDTVFIAHTYVQNGDLMYDPAIEFSFDTENHRAEALSYELSGMGIYEDFRDGDRPDQKADVEEMALDTMFENIKAYDYERTQFNVEDNREAEKEKGEDFER